jgi:hypothetical protein
MAGMQKMRIIIKALITSIVPAQERTFNDTVAGLHFHEQSLFVKRKCVNDVIYSQGCVTIKVKVRVTLYQKYDRGRKRSPHF